jgi:hypothetical protein
VKLRYLRGTIHVFAGYGSRLEGETYPSCHQQQHPSGMQQRSKLTREQRREKHVEALETGALYTPQEKQLGQRGARNLILPRQPQRRHSCIRPIPIEREKFFTTFQSSNVIILLPICRFVANRHSSPSQNYRPLRACEFSIWRERQIAH